MPVSFSERDTVPAHEQGFDGSGAKIQAKQPGDEPPRPTDDIQGPE